MYNRLTVYLEEPESGERMNGQNVTWVSEVPCHTWVALVRRSGMALMLKSHGCISSHKSCTTGVAVFWTALSGSTFSVYVESRCLNTHLQAST